MISRKLIEMQDMHYFLSLQKVLNSHTVDFYYTYRSGMMVQNCRFMTNYSLPKIQRHFSLHLILYLAIEKTTIQIEMDGFLGGYRLTKGKISIFEPSNFLFSKNKAEFISPDRFTDSDKSEK